MVTIKILAGMSSSGEKVYEELPVRPVNGNTFQILTSPGLVLGIAKGDEILFESESGEFEITKRGQNVCVQLFVRTTMSGAVDRLEKQVIEQLNGTRDGATPLQSVFTIHVSKGFAAIEQVFSQFAKNNPGAEWYYGNVYDSRDGISPLNWWNE